MLSGARTTSALTSCSFIRARTRSSFVLSIGQVILLFAVAPAPALSEAEGSRRHLPESFAPSQYFSFVPLRVLCGEQEHLPQSGQRKDSMRNFAVRHFAIFIGEA